MPMIRLAVCCGIALMLAYWWMFHHWWLLIAPVYGVIALAWVDLVGDGKQ